MIVLIYFLSMSIMNERFESIATLWLHGLNTAQGRSVARILMKLGYILHSTSAVPLSKLYVTYMVYQFRALVLVQERYCKIDPNHKQIAIEFFSPQCISVRSPE